MSIRWITSHLGTAAANSVPLECTWTIIDARSLVDGDGNPAEKIRKLIDQGLSALNSGHKTVICCDYGMSRSNALAAGILSEFRKISFSEAVLMVQEATGETDIKPGPLIAVNSALKPSLKSESKNPGRVLLTGASGAIGTRLLGEDWKNQLVYHNRNNLDLCGGSTLLQMAVQESGAETIIHLAASRISATNAAIGNSLTMLKNVIDVCISENVRLIFPSCSDVYFGYRGDVNADELVARRPKGHRGESKHLAETLIEHYRNMYGLKCTILRFARIYGADNMAPKFIYFLIERAKKGLVMETHVFGNGDARLDMLHVDDAISAIKAALYQTINEDFNLGSGQTISTTQIANSLRDKFGLKNEIHRIQIGGEASIVTMNYRKASELLGWYPRTHINDWLNKIK